MRRRLRPPLPRAPSPARAARAFALAETLVALAVLGILVSLGLTLFQRRRELERELLDQAVAVRALGSEWAVLRTSSAAELVPQEEGPFLGPVEFLSAIEERDPLLTIEETKYPGLVKVRLEIGAGVKRSRRLVQEGWVRLPGGG